MYIYSYLLLVQRLLPPSEKSIAVNNNNNNNSNNDDTFRNITPLRAPIDHGSLRLIPYRAVNTFSVDHNKSENVVFRDAVYIFGKRVVYFPNII
jgi:hypothetical protein